MVQSEVFPNVNVTVMSTYSFCMRASTCMSEVSIYFRQSEVESPQSSQQCTVSQGVPEVAPFVAVAVTHAAVTPHYTLSEKQKRFALMEL